MLTVEEEYFKDKDDEGFDAPTDLSYDGLKQEQIHERTEELQQELEYESIEIDRSEVYPSRPSRTSQ